MKKVTIIIEDNVYDNVRSVLGLRKAMGNFYGELDEFLGRLFAGLDKGEDPIHFQYKKDKERK